MPLAILCAASSTACAPRSSTIDLVSYKDPYFPEPYYVTFDECVYRVDAGGDHRLVARSTSPKAGDSARAKARSAAKDTKKSRTGRGGTSVANADQAGGEAGDAGNSEVGAADTARDSAAYDAAPTPVRHYLDVAVYWKPRPGKTPTHSSTMDATLRYAVVTPSGSALYRGNGFVYLRKDVWTGRWIGTLESGHLRLESSTGSLAGDPDASRPNGAAAGSDGAAAGSSGAAAGSNGAAPAEILGDSRITGTLVAKTDPGRAVDILRELDVTVAASSSTLAAPNNP